MAITESLGPGPDREQRHDSLPDPVWPPSLLTRRERRGGDDRPPWELHSSIWMCLHQRLIEAATRSTSRATPELSPVEQVAWQHAVEEYRAAGGHGNMTFAKPMVITADALTQVADDATEPLIDAPLGETLLRAAPIYRKHWWANDDRANRFFIAYAAAMLEEAGVELVRRHAVAETWCRTPLAAAAGYASAPPPRRRMMGYIKLHLA